MRKYIFRIQDIKRIYVYEMMNNGEVYRIGISGLFVSHIYNRYRVGSIPSIKAENMVKTDEEYFKSLNK